MRVGKNADPHMCNILIVSSLGDGAFAGQSVNLYQDAGTRPSYSDFTITELLSFIYPGISHF